MPDWISPGVPSSEELWAKVKSGVVAAPAEGASASVTRTASNGTDRRITDGLLARGTAKREALYPARNLRHLHPRPCSDLRCDSALQGFHARPRGIWTARRSRPAPGRPHVIE